MIMNKHLKDFLHRGLVFGGFGPIIAGAVYLIISETNSSFSLGGREAFTAILTTYFLAFLQAGSSVFNQIESWSLPKSLLCHFATVYAAYTGTYILNSWIPFKISFVIIFTLIFVVSYFVIWFAVYFSVRAASKKLNLKLK